MNTASRVKTYTILITVGAIGILLSLLLIPFPFEKNVVELQQKMLLTDQQGYLYDLDQDGQVECARTKSNIQGEAAVVAETLNKGIINQWNLGGSYLVEQINQCVFCDLDKNGSSELVLLCLRNDSIILHLIDPFDPGENSHYERFVLSFKETPPKGDISASVRAFTDLNRDGYPEVLFSVNLGLSGVLRRIYAYDPVADSLWSSVDLGNKCFVYDVEDVNKDGYPELFLQTGAQSNIDSSHAFHDQGLYLFVLNASLEFFIQPIYIPCPYGYLRAFPYELEGVKGIGGILVDKSNQENELILCDMAGHIIYRKSIVAQTNLRPSLPYIICKNNRIRIWADQTDIVLKGRPPDFSITQSERAPRGSWASMYDKERSGKWQISRAPNLANIYLRNSETERELNLVVDEQSNFFTTAGIISESKRRLDFFIQIESYLYYYSWYRNPLYPWYYAYYPLVTLFWFALILFIYRTSRARFRQQFQLKSRLQELEILTVKNQISPHFTFNAINSIGSLIYQEKKETAYDFLRKFSDLIRNTLDHSMDVSIHLEQEVAFVKNFLELEQLRFKDKLSYSINVDKSVNLLQPIPKMMLQIHTENAIKHGIMPAKHLCILQIHISEEASCLKVSIQDDGVGRKASAHSKNGTGKGLQMLRQMYDYYEMEHKVKIHQHIIDLSDMNGLPAGTRIIVEINKNHFHER